MKRAGFWYLTAAWLAAASPAIAQVRRDAGLPPFAGNRARRVYTDEYAFMNTRQFPQPWHGARSAPPPRIDSRTPIWQRPHNDRPTQRPESGYNSYRFMNSVGYPRPYLPPVHVAGSARRPLRRRPPLAPGEFEAR